MLSFTFLDEFKNTLILSILNIPASQVWWFTPATHRLGSWHTSPMNSRPARTAEWNQLKRQKKSRQISHDSFQISGKVNFHYVQFHLGVPRDSDVLISSRFGLSGWVLFIHMNQTGHQKIDVRTQEVAEPVIGDTWEFFQPYWVFLESPAVSGVFPFQNRAVRSFYVSIYSRLYSVVIFKLD